MAAGFASCAGASSGVSRLQVPASMSPTSGNIIIRKSFLMLSFYGFMLLAWSRISHEFRWFQGARECVL